MSVHRNRVLDGQDFMCELSSHNIHDMEEDKSQIGNQSKIEHDHKRTMRNRDCQLLIITNHRFCEIVQHQTVW